MYGPAEAAQQAGVAGQRVPELGRLKQAAERIAACTGRVVSFLYRFNGPRVTGEQACPPSPPDSYRNDIDTLFSVLSALEDRVIALDDIG